MHTVQARWAGTGAACVRACVHACVHAPLLLQPLSRVHPCQHVRCRVLLGGCLPLQGRLWALLQHHLVFGAGGRAACMHACRPLGIPCRRLPAAWHPAPQPFRPPARPQCILATGTEQQKCAKLSGNPDCAACNPGAPGAGPAVAPLPRGMLQAPRAGWAMTCCGVHAAPPGLLQTGPASSAGPLRPSCTSCRRQPCPSTPLARSPRQVGAARLVWRGHQWLNGGTVACGCLQRQHYLAAARCLAVRHPGDTQRTGHSPDRQAHQPAGQLSGGHARCGGCGSWRQ